jgi:hypothetical protein
MRWRASARTDGKDPDASMARVRTRVPAVAAASATGMPASDRKGSRRSRSRAPRGTSAATSSTIPRPRHSVSASASPLVWSTGQASLSASGRLPWRTGKTTALHPCQNRSPAVIRFHWRARSCSRVGTAAIHALPSGGSTAARSGAVRAVRACIGTEPPFSLTGARTGSARLSASSAEPMRSTSRDPRREDDAIWTTTGVGAVFTVRRHGTRRGYEPRLSAQMSRIPPAKLQLTALKLRRSRHSDKSQVMTEDHDLRILGRLAAAQQHQPAEDLDHEQVEQAEGHKPRSCRNRFIRPSRRSQYLWRVLNRYRLARLHRATGTRDRMLGNCLSVPAHFRFPQLEFHDAHIPGSDTPPSPWCSALIYSTGARECTGPLSGRGHGCLAGWLRCSSAAMVWLSSFQLFSNLARPSRSSCPVTSAKSTPAVAS